MSRRFGNQRPFGGHGSNSDTVGSTAVVQRSTAAILQQACVSGSLRLANRELTSLPTALFDLSQVDYSGKKWWEEQDLHTVDFSHNQLQSIPSEFANVLGCIRILIASYNRLQAFQSNFLLVCQATLTKLDLSHNRLTAFFDFEALGHAPAFASLLEVDLSHNLLERVAGFSTWCPELKSLDLSNNRLVAFESQPQMQSSRQPCRQVAGAPPFAALRSLKLANNALSTLPAALMLESNAAIEAIDLSCNQLTLVADDGKSLISFGPSLTSLNLKQNRITELVPEQIFTPRLKELLLGNNGLERLAPTLFVRSPMLGFLDLSNNRLTNVDAVLRLEHLVRLDLQNNDLTSLNPRMCLLTKLNSIVLDGNPLRSIRRDVISRGTPELLKYLRTRLSLDENDEERMVGDAVQRLPLQRSQQVDEPQQPPATSAAVQTQLSRPYATTMNASVSHPAAGRSTTRGCGQGGANFCPPPASKAVPDDARLIHAGERSGTTWDVSAPPSAPGGRRGFGPVGGAGVGGSGALLLPPVVDLSLNFSTMHAHESAPFRNQVTTIRLSNQPHVEVLFLSFAAQFPNLKELEGSKCAKLCEIAVDSEKVAMSATGAVPPLQSLIFPNCSFSGTLLPTLLGAPCSPIARSVTRLEFSANRLTSLPPELASACPALRFINLNSNTIRSFPVQLLKCHELLELCIARNGLNAVPRDDDGDTEGYAQRCWPKLQVLDLSFNELETVPFTFGNLQSHLRSFSIEGNRIKWLRASVLQKGSSAVMQYLQDKIPRPA